MRLIDFTNDELANALHEIEAHEDSLDADNLAEFLYVKRFVMRVAMNRRTLEASDARHG